MDVSVRWSDSAIGRKLVDPWTREAYTIVGVAPPGLDYPSGVECWSTITRTDSTVRTLAIVRLRPGAARDIGIRVALGATPSLIRAAVLRRAMTVSALGAAGLTIALGGTRFLRSMLFGVSPSDPVTLSVVSMALLGVTLAAAYLPARRATKIDAMVALRE